MRASIGAPGCLYTGTDCPNRPHPSNPIGAIEQASSKLRPPVLEAYLRSSFIPPPARKGQAGGKIPLSPMYPRQRFDRISSCLPYLSPEQTAAAILPIHEQDDPWSVCQSQINLQRPVPVPATLEQFSNVAQTGENTGLSLLTAALTVETCAAPY